MLLLEKRLQDQELNGTLAEGTSARLQLNEFKASVQNGLKTGLLELEQRYEASQTLAHTTCKWSSSGLKAYGTFLSDEHERASFGSF